MDSPKQETILTKADEKKDDGKTEEVKKEVKEEKQVSKDEQVKKDGQKDDSSKLKDTDIVHYFAIGSMINPVSLQLRDLFPSKTVPAILPGWETVFVGAGGMASVERKDNWKTHGVLHYITRAEMNRLDKIEWIYDKVPVTVELYDGTKVEDAIVYQMDRKKVTSADAPPGERYIDIITRGCKHFGVKDDFINWLKSLKVTPRKKHTDYKSFPNPEEEKYITAEEMAKYDGLEGRDLYVGCNGKVLKYIGDKNTTEGKTFVTVIQDRGSAGKDITLYFARALYEPLFSLPTKYADMTELHRQHVEDMYFSMSGKHWKPVAYLKTDK